MSNTNLLQSPAHHSSSSSKTSRSNSTRRSLRERLRDGITTTTNVVSNPFQQSSATKSKSIDSSTPSNLYHQTTSAAMDFLSSPFELINKLKSSSHELYTVQTNDTLTSIAANYESTPSELIKLNKLGSRLVFPGQVLKIPANKSNLVGKGAAAGARDEDKSDFSARKFIKLGVRHVTDGNGVISGTLLVTPNAVMFDPNVSDPLVIEQGAELYGVILPFELIAAAGIYNDISGMRVKGMENIDTGQSSRDCVLYPGAGQGPGSSQGAPAGDAVFDEATQQLEEETPLSAARRTYSTSSSSPPIQSLVPGHAHQIHSSTSGDDLKAKVLKRLSFPLTWSGLVTGEDNESSQQKYKSLVSLQDVPDLRASFEKLLPQSSPQQQSNPTSSQQNAKNSSNISMTTQSNPLSTSSYTSLPPNNSTSTYNSASSDDNWFLCLTTGYNPSNKPKLGHMISYGSKTQCRPEYWFGVNCNSDVDELYRYWMLWWPHLYGGVDGELISSRGMQLVDWDTVLFSSDSPQHSKQPIQHQSSSTTSEQLNDLGKESWEMIKAPYTKLYSFIRTGLSSTSSSTDLEWSSALDFFDVTDPEEQSKVVSMTEELHRLLNNSSEYDHYIPELSTPSEILTEQDVESLSKNLTARAQGYPWSLVFSTTKHGFSLSTLYRRMEECEGSSPVLVVVEDTKLNVFGALLSTTLRVSDGFYGTGQSFLFILRQGASTRCKSDGGDEEEEEEEEDAMTKSAEKIEGEPPLKPPATPLKLFKWTGENNYFIKGNLDGVSIGSGDGHFGLYFDSDLFVGRTEHCTTYNNPPLVPDKDFVVKTMECWCFGSSSSSCQD